MGKIEVVPGAFHINKVRVSWYIDWRRASK